MVPRLPGVTSLQVLALIIWATLFNLVGLRTWRHGRETFAWLLLDALLTLALPRIARLTAAGSLQRPRRHLGALLSVAVGLMAVHLLWGAFVGLRDQPSMTDIPRNTWQAGEVMLQGENPYASHCQLWARLENQPHVEHTRKGTTLYGVPYRYGFPYFPVMMAGYLPARLFGLGKEGIRAWNLVITAATLWGVILLARLLAPDRRGAALVAVAAFLSVWVYPVEIFEHTVVDILVAALAVYAFLALAHERWILAGVLLGLAQGCKLLPAPVLLLAILVWSWGRPGWRRFLLGYVATSVAVIGPFVAWAPREFFSATILFYLVYHAGGDTTALYYYLPPMLRMPQQVVGFVLTLLVGILPARRGRPKLVAAIAGGFAAYVVFIAFGRMSHLNYLWSVWPLGCVALGVLTPPREGAADSDPARAV